MCVDTDTGCTPETYPCSPHATVQPQLSQGLLESTVGAGVWPLVSAAGRSPAEMGLPLVHPLLGRERTVLLVGARTATPAPTPAPSEG